MSTTVPVRTVVVTVIVGALVLYAIHRLKGTIMTAAQDAVDAITAKLDKAKDEILTEIETLKAQVAEGQTPDLSRLEAAAQALDDVVPDVEPSDPEPEEPAE